MKIKSGAAIFVCQPAEGILKAVKYVGVPSHKREVAGMEAEKIPLDMDEKVLGEKIKQIFKKLGYNNDPIIVSLPRHQATCRYLKIPSVIPQEIERISCLQSARYFPYPAAELVTGYEVIHTGKEGYSYINLIIAHKDIIERCIRLFKELKPGKFVIALSSYGLCNLYNYINPQASPQPAIIVDIDSPLVEIVIVSDKKMLFSRSFGLSLAQADWETILVDEINKTCNAYLKEVPSECPGRIVILNSGQALGGLAEVLAKKTSFSVEISAYADKIKFPNQRSTVTFPSANSFAGILGLGLNPPEDSLNLLPKDIKQELKNNSLKKDRFKVILLILGIIFISALGMAKTIDNKIRYLALLNAEVNKIAKEAKPIEQMDKTLRIMNGAGRRSLSALGIISALHKIIPGEVYLTNFTYEENNQVILHGQAPELEAVFAFVSGLEKSPEFKGFNIRVKYASQKKARSNEVIDFEIICTKG